MQFTVDELNPCGKSGKTGNLARLGDRMPMQMSESESRIFYGSGNKKETGLRLRNLERKTRQVSTQGPVPGTSHISIFIYIWL